MAKFSTSERNHTGRHGHRNVHTWTHTAHSTTKYTQKSLCKHNEGRKGAISKPQQLPPGIQSKSGVSECPIDGQERTERNIHGNHKAFCYYHSFMKKLFMHQH